MEEDVNGAPLSTEPADLEPAPVVDEPTVEPGDKTPPHLLLKSLKEEREERRKLEERIALLETSNSPDVFSDEGQALQKQIREQDSKIDALLTDNAKKDTLIAHPEMKDLWGELETFREDPENKGMNLRTAVKAFLIEKGLFEPQRKGLERTTGGPRTPPPSQDMTAEEVGHLRKTNFKKYSEMLEKGQIKV